LVVAKTQTEQIKPISEGLRAGMAG
jgi:hypothetical protein